MKVKVLKSPLLRRKKKDRSGEIKEGFEESNENEISNQDAEFAPEMSFELNKSSDVLSKELKNDERIASNRNELNESSEVLSKEPKNDEGMASNRNEFEDHNTETLNGGHKFPPHKKVILEGLSLPEKLKGYSKNDKEMTPNRDEVENKEEISEDGAQFPAKKIMISDEQSPPESLEDSFKNDKRMTPKRDEFKEDSESIYNEGAQFSSNDNTVLGGPSSPDRLKRIYKNDYKRTPYEDAFIEVKKEISVKGIPCPIEKFMLWDGPMVKEQEVSSQSFKLEAAEKSSSSEDENEKAEENRQLAVERSEVSKCSWNPDQNLNFEVDFENAFEKNLTESDAEESWCRVASTNKENLCKGSKQTYQHQLPLENENIIDAEFDAFFGLHTKICDDNSLADGYDVFPENTHRKGFCNVQKKIDDHYDFEEDYNEFSDEEKSLKTDQKKKQMVVSKHRPSKGQKLFQYLDVDNMICVREMKDPLMKKYYSAVDLSRKAPDFFIAFTKRKE